jgi:hypothetical protein
MGMGKEVEEPYKGADRVLSESAKRLAAAGAAMPFSGAAMAAAAERARNLIKQTPIKHRPIREYPLHVVIPNPPITRTITFPKGQRHS